MIFDLKCHLCGLEDPKNCGSIICPYPPEQEDSVKTLQIYPKIRLYTASKLRHATMWQQLRSNWREIQFISRWIDLVGKCPDTQEFAEVFWIQDLQDVRCSDVVLVYGSYDDNLRGALIEAGAALALGIFVIVVGNCQDYGTWKYHPHVLRAEDFNHARVILSELEQQIHPRLPVIT